jgi:DNA-binding MarR family transcriptional regulator
MEQADTDVRWLDEREMVTWRAFVETVHDLLRAFENDLGRDGLTLGDYQVLVYLAEARSPMRMSDLASRLQLTPSGLTRRLDGLVQSGDVERVPDDIDRRVMLARLTRQGRERLSTVAPRHVASVREYFIDRIPNRDLDAVGRAFLKIREHLNGEETASVPSGDVPERLGPRRGSM